MQGAGPCCPRAGRGGELSHCGVKSGRGSIPQERLSMGASSGIQRNAGGDQDLTSSQRRQQVAIQAAASRGNQAGHSRMKKVIKTLLPAKEGCWFPFRPQRPSQLFAPPNFAQCSQRLLALLCCRLIHSRHLRYTRHSATYAMTGLHCCQRSAGFMLAVVSYRLQRRVGRQSEHSEVGNVQAITECMPKVLQVI